MSFRERPWSCGLRPYRTYVATIAKCGFGMNVIGYDPFLKQEQLGDLITLVESQDEVFKQADFVSLHTPLTPETEHSIGMREFKLMKPTASFINASRGEVVNEAELIRLCRRM